MLGAQSQPGTGCGSLSPPPLLSSPCTRCHRHPGHLGQHHGLGTRDPPSLLALRQQLLTPTEGWLEITENSLKMPPQQKVQPGYGRETPGEQGEATTMRGGLRLSALRGLGAHRGSTQGSLSHRGHE